MKIRTQNSLLILWTCVCTAVLFGIAVMHDAPKTGASVDATLPDSTSQERAFLSHTGSGTIQSTVSSELSYMIALTTHSEKGLLFAEYMAKSTDNPEVRFLADNLTRRLRYASLQLREWLQAWYGFDTNTLPDAAISLSNKDDLRVTHTEFFAFMLRHNPWEGALHRAAINKGLRQELAHFASKNSQTRRLEFDVIRHLGERF